MSVAVQRKQTTARQVMAWMPYDKVAVYLVGDGWEEDGSESRGRRFKKRVDPNTFRVVVPFDTALRDYPLFMMQAVRSIAHAQSRSEVEVVRDIYQANELSQGVVTRVAKEL